MYFKIGFRKSFVLFTGKHASWSLLLMALQAFFDRTSLVAASTVFKNSYKIHQGNISGGHLIDLPF